MCSFICFFSPFGITDVGEIVWEQLKLGLFGFDLFLDGFGGCAGGC